MEKPPSEHDNDSSIWPSSEMDGADQDQLGDLEKVVSNVPTHRSSSSKKDAATRTVTAQDWTGPDDPENPHNWPRKKKIYHMTIPGIFCFIV